MPVKRKILIWNLFQNQTPLNIQLFLISSNDIKIIIIRYDENVVDVLNEHFKDKKR